MASVEPQQTVTWVSGSTSRPAQRFASAAMARRSAWLPQVTAYWLMSCSIAATAAALTCAGAGKSGKPCARLTA